MRTLLHKFFPEKTEWNFQKANLTESKKMLENPVRGWYRLFPFLAEKEPDFEPMSWCEIEADTLALVIINIGAYREKELDEAALGNIRSILNFFVKKNYDLILRITYDHEGKAVEREPFFFATVKGHLQQLTPIIKEFAEHIFVYQGMLVGNWGEMHTSRFLDPVKLREMWKILRSEVGEGLYYAVRRPSYWRLLHPNNDRDNMGLFDDAIFGSESHLGTFGNKPKGSADWDSLWQRQDELAFEEVLCTYVPNGGEVVCGEQYTQTENVGSTIATLRKMHITYLNRQYDEKILKIWKEWKWEEAGIWQNSSLYEYISNHLGYRFWIKDVVIVPVKKSEKQLLITITIENVGFANLYQEAELTLEWIDTKGIKNTKQLEYDMRSWNSGKEQTISSEMVPENCTLYLSAKRKRDGRSIYFANQTMQDGRVLLGRITDVCKA